MLCSFGEEVFRHVGPKPRDMGDPVAFLQYNLLHFNLSGQSGSFARWHHARKRTDERQWQHPQLPVEVSNISYKSSPFSLLNAIEDGNCRVDFESFRLAPPNPESTVCEDDYFHVTGSLTPTPKICGDSYDDQHSNYFRFISHQFTYLLSYTYSSYNLP